MNFEAILSDLKAKKYQPVYFLMGEESYYIDYISDYISNEVLNDAEKEFNLTVLYAKDIDIQTVISTAKQFPFMGERMVVIVKEAQQLKKIEQLENYLNNPQESTILVPSDDAGIVAHEKNTLVSSDLLIEGIHFDMTYTPLKHLGYKSVVVNLSDIYAMNAKPKQITVSLGFSSKYTLEAIDELYDGILLACKKYNVDIIGGDISSSPFGLIISVTALGENDENNIVKRSGAKENDLIVVSGDLGGAYLGLTILQ